MDDGGCGFGAASGSGGRGLELTYRWNAISRREIGALGTGWDIVVVMSVLLTSLSAHYRNSIVARDAAEGGALY